MTIDVIVARLEGVRQTGRDRGIARCPAHDDKGPSLSYRELDDGRVLLHCFAGCDVHEIVAAVGLELSDLFPPKPLTEHRYKSERRPFNAHDILACLAFEAAVTADCSRQLQRGATLSEVDHERLITAGSRLAAGAEMANG